MIEIDDAAVQARAVRIVAQIHHSHGVKAALAYGRLRQRFARWSPDVWRQVLTRARWHEELTIDVPALAPVWDVSAPRARSVIARAVVPACYSAVRAWAAAEGGEAVARAYLDVACADPDELGHRVSILLAFIESWPIYRATDDEALWLDRLCEFLLACQFGGARRDMQPPAKIAFEEALDAALQRPGFFGHHVITLSWVHRNGHMLSNAQRWACLGGVVRASAAAGGDPLTGIDSAMATDEQALEAELRRFLCDGTPNVHLLTLADAVLALWPIARADQRRALLRLMQTLVP